MDSRDIVELQLKQADYELTIRKKEALEPPPQVSQPYPYPAYASPQAPPPPPPVAVSAPASAPPSKVVPALPAPGKTSASSHPRLKCPMAGTFYRCPGPGEPPFVKACISINVFFMCVYNHVIGVKYLLALCFY